MWNTHSASLVAVLVVSVAAHADLGAPLPGLSPDEQTRFSDGLTQFSAVENVADGLGPVFNDNSCAACHGGPASAIGGNGSPARLETRFGALKNNTTFDPLIQLGGSLIQVQGIGRGDASAGLPDKGACRTPFTFVGETVPVEATVAAQRRTTPLFGLGLVDATPDATFRNLAQHQQQATPATAGVVSLVTNVDTGNKNVVGRFGWKAQNATLHEFSGDAYLNEMGITNPSFPAENAPQGDNGALTCNPVPKLNDDGADVTKFTDFMIFLAPPTPLPLTPRATVGQSIFSNIGCADCHTPTLTTGPNASNALNLVRYAPYSDFLLHDMGTLGDGITQNQATGRLMRTAPLWGVRVQTTLLHDGRASSLTAAISDHDGQAAPARDRFNALIASDQRALLDFLSSL